MNDCKLRLNNLIRSAPVNSGPTLRGSGVIGPGRSGTLLQTGTALVGTAQPDVLVVGIADLLHQDLRRRRIGRLPGVHSGRVRSACTGKRVGVGLADPVSLPTQREFHERWEDIWGRRHLIIQRPGDQGARGPDTGMPLNGNHIRVCVAARTPPLCSHKRAASGLEAKDLL